MKFSEMNKDQKQLLILGLGGAFTVFLIVSNLLVKPAKLAAEKAETTIQELESKVNRGELVLERDPRVRKETRESAKRLLEIARTHLPPQTGRYGWALENITGIFEELGIFFRLEEIRGIRYIPLKPGQEFDPDSVSMWIPYAVQVEFQSSFENLKKILSGLKEKFPYSSIANMQVNAVERYPNEHNITIIMEWPVFRLDEDLVWLSQQAGESTP